MTSLCPNPTWSLTARPMRCYRPQEERIVFQPFFKGKLAVKLRSPGCRIWSSWWIISTSHPEWESPHPQKHLQIEWRSFRGVKQMYTFLSPASWILSFKIPQVGPTFRNMETLSFPPKDGLVSIQFFLVKKRFDARKSKQLCWIWWGWLESQVGHPLSKPGDHEFIGTLGNSQGGPGHLEAQPPRWCFSSQRGGSRGEAKLMWQNRLHTLIRCFFFGCSQLLGRESPESGKVLEVPLFWSGEISLCADLQLNLTWKIPCGFAARLYLALADSPSHSCTVVEMPLPKMASSGAGFDGFFHAGMDLAKPLNHQLVGWS